MRKAVIVHFLLRNDVLTSRRHEVSMSSYLWFSYPVAIVVVCDSRVAVGAVGLRQNPRPEAEQLRHQKKSKE